MLEDVLEIRRVVLACGTVDLRKGIDGLAMIIGVRNPVFVLRKPFGQDQRTAVDGNGVSSPVQAFRSRTPFLAKDHTGSSGTYGRTIPLPDDGVKSAGAKGQKSNSRKSILMIVHNRENFFCFSA